MSCSGLLKEQRANSTLTVLFQSVHPLDEVKNLSQAYLIQNHVLLKKWVPHSEYFVGEPIYQVVVPSKFHDLVLSVSYNEFGHMSVVKTYDRIMRHLFDRV